MEDMDKEINACDNKDSLLSGDSNEDGISANSSMMPNSLEKENSSKSREE